MSAYVAGDAAAFRQLFDRFGPILLRLARAASMSEADAHDLVQQAFLQMHRARRDFRQGERVRPWLLTIAHNLKRDHLRRRSRWRLTELDPDSPPAQAAMDVASGVAERDPVELVDAAKDALRLQSALRQIPPAQQQVIALHWFAGASFPEVASVLGVSVSAVKVRAHRGYERLRELLGASATRRNPGARHA